jgi:TPR repeat protein
MCLAGLLLATCKVGGSAEEVRPRDMTYSEGTGNSSCRPVENFGEPLVVDWRPELRGDLEIAMRDSVAVVQYDCHTLRILKDCTAEGTYAFAGMTRKEQVLQLANGDEIRANLPRSGPTLAARLEGDVQRGASLDIALVMVGKLSTTRATVRRPELRGECRDATHFVRRATVGAFSMRTGTKARVRTVAELMGAGADASSSSIKEASNRDGSLESCMQASPDAARAPSQCAALLRLELQRIDVEGDDRKTVECAPGMVVADGKCAAPDASRAHLCNGEANDCEKQCSSGDGQSCYQLAGLFDAGKAVPKDDRRASQLLRQSCEGGYAPACTDLGFRYTDGIGVQKDLGEAVRLSTRGCDAGNYLGCNNLGSLYESGRGVPSDFVKALGLYKRACDGGVAIACANLGAMYSTGRGVTADKGRAAELAQRACDGGNPAGCSNLGRAYELGDGVPKDVTRARTLFEAACRQDNQLGCAHLAFSLRDGVGGPTDLPRAIKLWTTACDASVPMACFQLGFLHFNGNGVPRDLPRAAVLFEKSCGRDMLEGCTFLGIMLHEGNGVTKDVSRAMTLFTHACDGYDGMGCAELATIYFLGKDAPMDLTRAVLFDQKGCDRGTPVSCTALARAHLDGTGGAAIDRPKALELFRKACTAGFAPACEQLKQNGGAMPPPASPPPSASATPTTPTRLSNTSYVGHWRYSRLTCNGSGVMTAGLTETLDISETSATFTMSANGCTATYTNEPVVRSGDSTVLVPAAAKVRCAPAPCTLQFSTIAADGSKKAEQYRCPADLPIAGPRPVLSVVNADLNLTADDGKNRCTTEFVRVR